MQKQKDSQITLKIRLKTNNQVRDLYMTYRHINKAISLLQIKTHKLLFSENQALLSNKQTFIEDFVIGHKFGIFIKGQKSQAQVLAFADQFTKTSILSHSNNLKNAFLMIKPGNIQNKKLGQIFSLIEKQFNIERFKMFTLTKENLSKYIVNDKMQNSENDNKNMDYLSSGPCFGFQLKGDKLLLRLRKFLGPQNPIQAKKLEPFSMRAKYGANVIHNCCYGSRNENGAKNEIEFIFSNQVQQERPRLSKSCLCLIKPHISISKKVGQILTFLLQKSVQITSMRFQTLPLQLIKTYLSMYKFLPQYQQNLKHFQQGKCLYIQITIPKSKNPVQQFKQFCGPYDPSYAKKISPYSIRAMFGIDRVMNAVHCTELIEDAETDLKVIFQC